MKWLKKFLQLPEEGVNNISGLGSYVKEYWWKLLILVIILIVLLIIIFWVVKIIRKMFK